MAANTDVNLDSGPRRGSRATERWCVAARVLRPVGELMRFVVGPDGELVPDLKRKLPGRGVWVTATRQALTRAIQRQAFARAFKREVRIPPDLCDRVDALVERSALDALAMARKAGVVAAGFTKVQAALQREAVAGLVRASDAGPTAGRMLASAARRESGAQVEIVELFRSAQLDLALGRANVVHAALLAGRAADSFLARCRSLERFRAAGPEDRHGASRTTEVRPADAPTRAAERHRGAMG